MFISEERLIVERIKDFVKNKRPREVYYVMLRDGHILNMDDYSDMISAGKITPQDAYVYIVVGWSSYKSVFYYPFLEYYTDFSKAYLSKLGFYYKDRVVPATGLKYVAITVRYGDYLSIELVDLDTTVSNTKLPKIAFEVLGEKLISGEKKLTEEEYDKITLIYIYQKLFAGYSFDGARNIIREYYNEVEYRVVKYYYGDYQSLVKEVARITMDYDRIFQPYRVCYNMETWKEIDCLSIKLD